MICHNAVTSKRSQRPRKDKVRYSILVINHTVVLTAKALDFAMISHPLDMTASGLP